ncbi:MAG: hypothetical protein AAF481_00020 [Acidobacteriota bacterium]
MGQRTQTPERRSTQDHPTEAIDQMIAGDSTGEQRRLAVRHLLRGCPQCASRTANALRVASQEPPTEQDLDSLFDRLVKGSSGMVERVEQEVRAAHRLLDDLDSLPAGRRTMVIRSSPRYHNRAVYQLLLERSVEMRRQDAATTLQLAELALIVAYELDDLDFADLKARALLEVANAHRISNDMRSAEKAFGLASQLIELEVADPRLGAQFAYLLASLRSQQQRKQEALELLAEAERLFRRLGDQPAAAQCLFKRSIICSDEVEVSLAAAWEGLRLLGPEAAFEDLLPGIHNLIDSVVQSGNCEAAQRMIRTALPVYRVGGRELDLFRLEWNEARIERQLGNLEASEQLFLSLQERFADRDLPHDVALVSLDLAEIYAHQGRTSDLQELAAEMAIVFQSLDVVPETLASLAMLQQAVARDAQTLSRIRQLADQVDSLRRAN